MSKHFEFKPRLCMAACMAVLGLVITGLAADAPANQSRIGASAVWQIPQNFVTSAHVACGKAAASGFAECFIDQMTKAGASADAVSLTRELYKQSGGDVGIMT